MPTKCVEWGYGAVHRLIANKTKESACLRVSRWSSTDETRLATCICGRRRRRQRWWKVRQKCRWSCIGGAACVSAVDRCRYRAAEWSRDPRARWRSPGSWTAAARSPSAALLQTPSTTVASVPVDRGPSSLCLPVDGLRSCRARLGLAVREARWSERDRRTWRAPGPHPASPRS